MEKDKLESLLIDYIDGNLSENDKLVVERELRDNPEASMLYAQLKEVMAVMDRSSSLNPSTALKSSFDKMLKGEIENTKGKVVFFRPAFYRAAAAVALLIVGGGLGYWINKYVGQQQEIARLEQQMKETKLMMMAMLDNQYSASQRIQGVNVALNEIPKADDEVVDALVKAMNEDPNTNVRLAALEALSKFHQEPGVRKVLIEALSRQTDPVVQIALIQLMVTMKEKGVVKDLERIIDRDETIKAVKDEAYSGIMKLS